MTRTTQSRTLGTILLATLLGSLAHAQTAAEQRRFERLVVAEAYGEGQLGMALVARSVLNRTALLRSRVISPGTYLARGRSLGDVINARNQYEPVSSGTINRPRSAQTLARARSAIELARDTPALTRALRRQGLGQAQINRLLSSTGFRTKSAFRDSSQNYDRQTFRNHVFNADRFSRRQNVQGTFARYYERNSGARSPAPRVASRTPATSASSQAASARRPASRKGPRAASPTAGDLARGQKGREVGQLQTALNRQGAQLIVDEDFGPATERALIAYQRKRGLRPTGRLDSTTQLALREASPRRIRPAKAPTAGAVDGVTPEQLRLIMPRLSERKAALYTPLLNRAMRHAKIDTPERRAAFLAILAHTSLELTVFESFASGTQYEGRKDLGNTTSGDGKRFKGRGPIQLTGRSNYVRMGKTLGLDLINSPDLAASPSIGFRVASAYWSLNDLNVPADQGNFQAITRAVTGGLKALRVCQRYHARARRVLGR